MTKHQNIYTNIVVLGGGESGTGAALLAARKGYKVFVSEYAQIKPEFKKILSENGIAFEEGGHSAEIVSKAGLVIKSPGISDRAPILQEVAGADIISEIEFASWFTKAKIIGITGSNGKTTTTALTYHILRNAGLNVGLGGNIGKSFAWQVATENFEYYVLEISSFQLDDIETFRPNVAVLTNITPDHLDRYNY
ncbi:MAG TPA: Mur ligase family protein, partial [Bacteroidales bacterium]|nr:Mur ligase family protein [Bacteroidales bacterium]